MKSFRPGDCPVVFTHSQTVAVRVRANRDFDRVARRGVERELDAAPFEEVNGDGEVGRASVAFQPKCMMARDIYDGYQWVYREVYN